MRPTLMQRNFSADCQVLSVKAMVREMVPSGLVFPSMSTFSNIPQEARVFTSFCSCDFVYTPAGRSDTNSKKESSGALILTRRLRSKNEMSEILYFLKPLSLFSCTTMLAGRPWESHSGDGDSSAAMAGDRQKSLDQKDPSSPNQPPPPPPPPPPVLPPFPALPPLPEEKCPDASGRRERRGEVEKTTMEAAEERAKVVERVLMRVELE
ncbi:hypothetical protein AAHE18_03G030300 [Arachis hypogaea]